MRDRCMTEDTNQMSEMLRHHELESLCCAGSVPGDHGIASHDLSDWSGMRVQPICSYLRAANVKMRPLVARGTLTRYAKSFAVKIPLRPSSSSTTNTQSVLLAAQSWLASATVIFSGTVSAGLGLSAATVPFATAGFPPRFPRLCWWVVEIVRFRASSDSIFFRIAC